MWKKLCSGCEGTNIREETSGDIAERSIWLVVGRMWETWSDKPIEEIIYRWAPELSAAIELIKKPGKVGKSVQHSLFELVKK